MLHLKSCFYKRLPSYSSSTMYNFRYAFGLVYILMARPGIFLKRLHKSYTFFHQSKQVYSFIQQGVV